MPIITSTASIEIRGCWGSESRHFLEAIQILEEHGHVPWREIGARTYPERPQRGARGRRSDADHEGVVDPWAE